MSADIRTSAVNMPTSLREELACNQFNDQVGSQLHRGHDWRSAAPRLSNLMRQVTVERHQQGVAGNCENSQQQSDGHDRINLAKIDCAG